MLDDSSSRIFFAVYLFFLVAWFVNVEISWHLDENVLYVFPCGGKGLAIKLH